MKEISNFFDKFNNVALKELKKRELICNAVEKVTKHKIEIKDISIKDGSITIKGNHGLKSEIFLKKRAIIDLLLNGNIKVFDIK